MAMKIKKSYPKSNKGGVSEDRLFEVELMLMNGEPVDRAKWGKELDALAEQYPDEFGYLKEEA